MSGPSTFRHAACTRCLRPQATCLCVPVAPAAHCIEVPVLQHPQEQRQAKSSMAMLRLSLAHREVADVVDLTGTRHATLGWKHSLFGHNQWRTE